MDFIFVNIQYTLYLLEEEIYIILNNILIINKLNIQNKMG